MKKIYLIIFNKTSFELDKDYEGLSEQDKQSISSMDPDSFFDFNTEDKYTLYIILSAIEIDKYSNILNNNLIEHTIEDISESILLNKFCIDSLLKPFVNALNRFRWNSYKKKLDEWIYENLDMDMVLDSIIQCGGIDNLRPIEKKFLRNFKN